VPCAAQPEENQPSGERNQPETGEAVEQHRGQCLAGAQPGGDQGEAEGSFGDSKAAGCDVEALRGDSRAVDQQQVVPGHGGAGGADAHGKDRCIGEPVGQGQAGHHHPARRGKLERAQPLSPGPDGLTGIVDVPVQQPGPMP
jgi:hypothetical protein